MRQILLYTYISEYNLILNGLDYLEIILWIISSVFFLWMGYKFYIKSKDQNKMFLYITGLFLLLIIARLIRFYTKFIIGYEYGTTNFTVTILYLSIAYNIVLFAAIFMFYFLLERTELKRTHHFFSFMVWVTLVLIIINWSVPEILVILIIAYAITLLGLPIIYIYIGIISTGEVRRRAFLISLSMGVLVFGILLDSPTVARVIVTIPNGPEFAQISSPLLLIIGSYLVLIGFRKKK